MAELLMAQSHSGQIKKQTHLQDYMLQSGLVIKW